MGGPVAQHGLLERIYAGCIYGDVRQLLRGGLIRLGGSERCIVKAK
jgi:hypothetical protein